MDEDEEEEEEAPTPALPVAEERILPPIVGILYNRRISIAFFAVIVVKLVGV